MIAFVRMRSVADFRRSVFSVEPAEYPSIQRQKPQYVQVFQTWRRLRNQSMGGAHHYAVFAFQANSYLTPKIR